MRTDSDRRHGVGWLSPFDNTCAECGHVWRSRGKPEACARCEASMDDGESVDVFARLRDTDDDDPLADLRRELERRQVNPSSKGLPQFIERVEPWDRDLPAGRSKTGSPHTGETSLWDRRRRQAHARDNNRCQVCGVRNSHHKEFTRQTLEVHHIVPRTEFTDKDACHALSNLITVCFRCHREVEGLTYEELRDVADRSAWLKSSKS